MKGLVPYAGMNPDYFPHSLQFDYVALAELMRGPDLFDWEPLERRLNAIANRGCHTILRVWLEYPEKTGGIPEFLIQEGLTVVAWRDGQVQHRTPDYTNDRLVSALERFIAAFGKRYDGDPRLGYLTAGLLGAWGEWHTYPREELFASKTVQGRVMNAYERAFKKTRVLLRCPAGPGDRRLADNAQRPFGYHDDSFAWATLDTGRAQDEWFYMPSLKAAGALDKWRHQPIGGEIRPELWGQVFDEKPSHPKAQDFGECIRETHVTWLMDSGLFSDPPSNARVKRASTAVRTMGYDFCVTEVEIANDKVSVTMRNQGVAPFYANWPAELAILSTDGTVRHRRSVNWRLDQLMPGKAATFQAAIPTLIGEEFLALRVPNPLPGGKGKPVRFANDTQDANSPGWLTLGTP